MRLTKLAGQNLHQAKKIISGILKSVYVRQGNDWTGRDALGNTEVDASIAAYGCVLADPAVTLRMVPARQMAVIRYSGLWSEKNYLENKLELELWIKETGLTIVGDPVWARYNPPFTPWFMRRN